MESLDIVELEKPTGPSIPTKRTKRRGHSNNAKKATKVFKLHMDLDVEHSQDDAS